ncbi:hypothetical protein ACFWFU_12685 [Streptomyces sp. NPDC060235]|uniref:hypothetical protein n=1 Tax=Streptomyces sp. NPDC060235 TaxID=3347080 RepID=UPI00365C18C4
MRTGLPHAMIVVDHFHVVQFANKMWNRSSRFPDLVRRPSLPERRHAGSDLLDGGRTLEAAGMGAVDAVDAVAVEQGQLLVGRACGEQGCETCGWFGCVRGVVQELCQSFSYKSASAGALGFYDFATVRPRQVQVGDASWRAESLRLFDAERVGVFLEEERLGAVDDQFALREGVSRGLRTEGLAVHDVCVGA